MLLLAKLNNKLKRAKFFIKLDQKGQYNYIHIKEGKEQKIAFRTQYSLYKY